MAEMGEKPVLGSLPGMRPPPPPTGCILFPQPVPVGWWPGASLTPSLPLPRASLAARTPAAPRPSAETAAPFCARSSPSGDSSSPATAGPSPCPEKGACLRSSYSEFLDEKNASSGAAMSTLKNVQGQVHPTLFEFSDDARYAEELELI